MTPRWKTALLFGIVLSGGVASAQQTTIGTPLRNNSDGFFENTGVNFGFSVPGAAPGQRGIVGLNAAGLPNPGGPIVFQQGGAAAAMAPFGNPNPAAVGNTFGFQILSPNGNFNFGLTATQGSSRGNVSQTPSVTTQNGLTAFISDTSQRPFVTSIVPVVGGFMDASQPHYMFPAAAPAVDSFGTSALGERLQRLGEAPGPRVGPVAQVNFSRVPIAPIPNFVGPAHTTGVHAQSPADTSHEDKTTRELVHARESTAGQPTTSIAEIRAQQASENSAADKELQAILDQAQQAMSLGKPNVARIYYSQLARRATGSLKQVGLDGLEATESQSKSARSAH